MKYLVTFQTVAEVEADSEQDAANVVRTNSRPIALSEPEVLYVTRERAGNGEGRWFGEDLDD